MTLTISRAHRLVGALEARLLAEVLGDSPETAIPVHLLRSGGGQVRMVGTLPDFEAVIIEDYSVGPELMAYGRDPYSFLTILQDVDGWEAVNLPYEMGQPLSQLIREELGLANHLVDDVYHLVNGPIPVFPHDDVRMLTHADIPLLEAAPDDIRDNLEEDLEMVLSRELIAGTVLPEAGVVAIAATYGFCEPYVDLAISTLAAFRCRGYAKAAASLIAAKTQEAGRIPIWSCAPTNISSLSVAYKLGFQEVSRRVNVVLENP